PALRLQPFLLLSLAALRGQLLVTSLAVLAAADPGRQCIRVPSPALLQLRAQLGMALATAETRLRHLVSLLAIKELAGDTPQCTAQPAPSSRLLALLASAVLALGALLWRTLDVDLRLRQRGHLRGSTDHRAVRDHRPRSADLLGGGQHRLTLM